VLVLVLVLVLELELPLLEPVRVPVHQYLLHKELKLE
jgi:hypothetical protein